MRPQISILLCKRCIEKGRLWVLVTPYLELNERTVEMVLLPLVFKELLSRLPEEVRGCSYLRVTAEKDTTAVSRIVQR